MHCSSGEPPTGCQSGENAMNAHDTRLQYVKGILHTADGDPTVVEPVEGNKAMV